MAVTLSGHLVTAKEAWDYVFKDVDPASRTNDETDTLNRIILGVSTALESTYGPLLNTTYTEKYDPSDTDILVLKRRPVVSVTSVVEGSTTLTEDTDYYVYQEEGYLRRYPTGAWGALTVALWGSTAPKSITVTYVAGRGASASVLPWDIKLAALVWTMDLWNTGPANLSNLLTETGAFVRPTAIPPQVQELMRPYARMSALRAV